MYDEAYKKNSSKNDSGEAIIKILGVMTLVVIIGAVLLISLQSQNSRLKEKLNNIEDLNAQLQEELDKIQNQTDSVNDFMSSLVDNTYYSVDEDFMGYLETALYENDPDERDYAMECMREWLGSDYIEDYRAYDLSDMNMPYLGDDLVWEAENISEEIESIIYE